MQKFEDQIALQGNARNAVSGMQSASFSSASAASSSTSITASAAATSAAGLQAQVVQQELIDPVIWQANITLPAFSGKGRLALREFERYYTDRTIPDRRGDVVYRKRVVEERLVYTEFFPLN